MKVGRPKKIENPQAMWQYFCDYRKSIEDNPIHIIEQKKGNTVIPKGINPKDAKELLNPIVELPARRPLTIEGFENYCADEGIIEDLGDYFRNKEDRYADFATICLRIKRIIRQDQIEGGMVGIYNPSITQRLNGLVDKTEVRNIEQPLFPD